MIGQAAIAWPRLFTPHEPSLDERFETIRTHVDLATACEIYLKEHSSFNDIFIQPTRSQLEDIAAHLDRYDISALRTTIEFRKYLFNYVS